jgi:hypothetical protein
MAKRSIRPQHKSNNNAHRAGRFDSRVSLTRTRAPRTHTDRTPFSSSSSSSSDDGNGALPQAPPPRPRAPAPPPLGHHRRLHNSAPRPAGPPRAAATVAAAAPAAAAAVGRHGLLHPWGRRRKRQQRAREWSFGLGAGESVSQSVSQEGWMLVVGFSVWWWCLVVVQAGAWQGVSGARGDFGYS